MRAGSIGHGGRRREASEAIAKAIALGGARLPQYQELQLKINEK